MHTSKALCYFSVSSMVPVVSIAGVLATSGAAADDNVWYVGLGGLGRVTVDRNVSDFDDDSITSGRVDDDDSGWKLFGGYRFNKHCSVELGYADLNSDPDDETTFVGQSSGLGSAYAAGAVSVDIDDPNVYYLAAVGRLPMPLGPAPYDDRLALVAKAGVMAWQATETTIDSSGSDDKDEDGTDVMFGLGIEYKWPNGIAIRSDWEFYRGVVDEDYELNTVALTYDF